jgi:NADH dehydrogenase/putative oxidoreductase
LAGAIAELARFGMSKEFRSFDPASARVVLVQSGDRVLPMFPENLSHKAKASLERLGIEVRLNGKVTRVDDQGVNINNERIEAATALWAAGVIASPAAKWIGAAADRAGRVKVAADLSVAGRPEVFVIGDTALALDAAGNPLPGLAPAAKQAGDYVGRLIDARLTGAKAPGPFRYRHRGSLATIGRKAAIADFGLVRLSGMVAWWLWGAVHVAFLVGARNRMAVTLDWLWAYVTFRRGIRLITGHVEG